MIGSMNDVGCAVAEPSPAHRRDSEDRRAERPKSSTLSRPSAQIAEDEWSCRMRAAIAGNDAPYRRLLEDTRRLARNVAKGMIFRSEVADAIVEDVAQETLIAVHIGRHSWDPSRSVR